ncbi:MAG TPA: tetratricopeptide repeat protein [Bacteroidota bacterium]|nr:tetratricopeptide repeat protein [Bacteroidota bacterium]
MKDVRLIFLFIILFLPLAPLSAQWYVNYENGRKAFKNGQWQQAVAYLSEAISDEPDSKRDKKTYGFVFIDYFPYAYRGAAYYRLGDLANARADLEKEKGDGDTPVYHAERDKEAAVILAEYLVYLQKPAAQAAQQKAPETPKPNPPQVAVQKPPATSEEGAPRFDAKKQRREDIEKAFASGVAYFNGDDLDHAEEQFKSVLALEPSHRRAAEFLNRIETKRRKLAAALRPKETPAAPHESSREVSAPAADTVGSAFFREAVRLLNGGSPGKAKPLFQKVNAVAPGYPELGAYMNTIASLEQSARAGISAYFHGEYRDAIGKLKELSQKESDNPHVFAILACSYAAEYLLAGSEDGKLKKEAVEAYGRVKGINPGYELDAKLISPGVIALLTGE